MEQKQEKFSTIGYIAAALGMCIGTGNVWRFPRVCAANGGGAFILAWTIAMLIFAVPLLSTEMAIGKKTRLGFIGSFRNVGILCCSSMFLPDELLLCTSGILYEICGKFSYHI